MNVKKTAVKLDRRRPTVPRHSAAGTAWFLSLCLVLALGCEPPLPFPPDRKEVLRVFETAPQPLAGSSGDNSSNPGSEEPLPQPALHIYIDGSGSMSGFLGQSDSAYRATLERLFMTVARLAFRESYFRFGTEVEAISSVAARDALSRSFYNSADTDITKLLGRIGASADDTVSIIVSDLVESTARREPEKLIAALRDLAERSTGSALYAFRSSFCCNYWIESDPSARGQRIQLRDLDGRGDRGRPFYLLVIAPSEPALERVQWSLLDKLAAAETFRASVPALQVGQVSYAPSGDAEPVWNLWSGPEKVGDEGVRHLGFFFERRAPRAEAAPLRLRLEAEATLSFYAPERASCKLWGIRNVGPPKKAALVAAVALADESAEESPESGASPSVQERARRLVTAYDCGCALAEWPEPEITAPESVADILEEVLPESEDDVYELICPVPRPEAYTWDAYRVKLSPGEGNLQVPAWVEQWTTGNDTRPDQGNRTLDLQEFVFAMLSAVTESQPFLDQIIVVGRGE